MSMTLNGTFTGVVDRIPDSDTAVILIERGEGCTDQQRRIPITELPRTARTDGSVLTLTMSDGDIQAITHANTETEQRREAVQSRLDRLSTELNNTDDSNE